MEPVVAPPKKSPVGKIIGCSCLAIIVAGIIGAVVIFFGVSKILKSNNPYKDSIAAVQSSPEAKAALGEPIKPGFLVTGNISTNNGEGEVDFKIPVSGPEGKGTITVAGSKAAGGNWGYETWELRVEGDPEPILLGK